jgi:hypothetical protein
MKYFYIFLNTLLCVSYSYGQVLPHGLFATRTTYSSTSIFADAQFKFKYQNSSPRIKSDFSYNFSNNTPYTFQFEFGIFDETPGVVDYQIPLIGFTNDLLNTDKAIVMYSFKQKYTSLGINNYKVDNNVIHHVLNSNVDLNKSNTQYGKPYNGYVSAVITTSYDGSRWKTYKNGILIDEIINTSIWNGKGDLIIGNDKKSNIFNNLYLYFDEIRFWNRSLSAVEIANNWNKPLHGNEEGLKLYYNFNDQGYPAYNSLAINNSHVQYLNDLSPNKYKGTFFNCGLYGIVNNFYKRISETYNPALFNPKFYFDANNEDCYPGTGKNNNNIPSVGKVYNLTEFNNNLFFYTNTNYNQIVSPNYNLDGGRSFLIDNIYGRSTLNSGITGTDPVTVETWVKFTSLDNQSIFLIGENSQYKQFEIKLRNGILSIGVGNQDFTIGPRNLTINKWYHIVYTFEKINYKIYFNGILDSETTFGNLVNKVVNGNTIEVSDTQNTSNTPIYIGVENSPFRGKISVLNVYNRLLIPSEILHKYNSTKNRFGY